MAGDGAKIEGLIGREAETRRLHAALRERRSQLIWGPEHSGKTFLVTNVLAALPAAERQRCITWSGPATRRQLVEHLVRGLFLCGDPFVREKVQADGCDGPELRRWVAAQSAVRLRGVFFTAAERGDYLVFLDHFPRPRVSHAVADLLKDIMHRTKTPVFLNARGYSPAEIGCAWSLYWADEYRLRLGPLSEIAARELLERCIERFGLSSLDLDDFRGEILHLSGHWPGAIARMCQLAEDPRYRYGRRVKLKLIRVDYLLQSNRSPLAACP